MKPLTEKVDDPVAALNKLADYLARRDHSEAELRRKLARRFSSSAIESALIKARQQGWLVEPQELSNRVAGQLHRKLKSNIYINHFLKTKGLPPVHRDEERELQKMHELLVRKFNLEHDFPLELRRKAYQYLRGRGFEDALIRKVIYEIKRNT